jgi:hypothetical protein
MSAVELYENLVAAKKLSATGLRSACSSGLPRWSSA